MNMETWSWIVEYKGQIHIAEINHDTDSGEQTLLLDREVIYHDFNEPGHSSVHKFYIDDLPCLLYIRYKHNSYQYVFKSLQPA